METIQEYLNTSNTIYIAVIAISVAIIFLLHVKSEGRTSPIAAGTFVILGPVLGVIITWWHAIREVSWREDVNRVTDALTNAPDMKQLSVRLICMGLAAAAIAAIVVATVKRNEWFNHLRRVK